MSAILTCDPPNVYAKKKVIFKKNWTSRDTWAFPGM